MSIVKWNRVVLTLLLACSVVGCDKSSSDQEGVSELKQMEGRVVIDGSSTVAPISQKAAEELEKEFGNVKVSVAISGTGDGFERFKAGETDISDASRPIKPGEFKGCQENRVSFIELPIAYDGLSIVINKDNNFVDQLTVDQLKKIFLREGGASTWKDVNPAWPDIAIKIFSPGTASGTFDYFFGDVVAKDEDNEHPREDMTMSEDDTTLVTGVAGEKGGIGFFGASYYFSNKDKLTAVQIVDPKTGKAVGPTPETIENGTYAPFSRPLFIYVNAKSMKRPEVKQFVKFYLENAAKLSTAVDYVPLPDTVYEIVQTHANERLTGTHFLGTDMSKKVGPIEELYNAEGLVDIE